MTDKSYCAKATKHPYLTPESLKAVKRKSTSVKPLIEALGHDNINAFAEYMFHPTRKWRMDLAIPSSKINLEIDGGCFIGGAHARGGYLRKQNEKQNESVLMGWRVLRCFPEDVRSGKALALIRAALAGGKVEGE